MRSPLRKPKFAEPRHFDYLSDSRKWSCKVCTPSSVLAERNSMTAHAALNHERTREHRENVRAREEWNPPQDVDAWINGTDEHVEQLKDFIPFWRRTIEVAESGKTLRFEDFFNALHQKNLKDKEEVAWNVPMPDWALESLEPLDVEQRSGSSQHVQLSNSGHDPDHEAFDFVEKIARMDLADSERKRRLHLFYKIPTSEKVMRIRELIDAVRAMEGAC